MSDSARVTVTVNVSVKRDFFSLHISYFVLNCNNVVNAHACGYHVGRTTTRDTS